MPEAGTVDMKLEVVTLPVCDIDRAQCRDAPGQFPWPLTEPAVPVSSSDLRFPQVGHGQLDEVFAPGHRHTPTPNRGTNGRQLAPSAS